MLYSYSEIDTLRTNMTSTRDRYLESWRKTALLISPNRFVDSSDMRNRGDRRDQKIINAIARRSLRTFVSGMTNGATPRSRPWFNLQTIGYNPDKRSEEGKYFYETTKIFHSVLQASNFYQIQPMAIADVGLFSNAAYGMLPHSRFGVIFRPFQIGTFAIASDSEGSVNTFCRDFTMTVRQVVESYGVLTDTGHIDWSNFDSYIKDAYESARYTDEVQLTNVILPNRRPKDDGLLARNKPYQSYTYVRTISGSNIGTQTPTSFRTMGGGGNSPKQKQFISVRGYDYFPVIAPRWSVPAEDDYGVDGPGDIATADVATLQELERGRLNAVDKILRPPMIGPAALRRHQSSILAGGITYLDETSGTGQFRPAFTVEPRVNELIGAKTDYENAIRSAFYEDLFLMLSSERTVSHVTARQIEEQAAEKLVALGPVMGQLDHDQGRPLINNLFTILSADKRGLLPPRPKGLEGREIRPEYISILAQAQKASLVNSTEKVVTFVDAVVKVTGDESLRGILKGPDIVRQYSDFVGSDPGLVRDEVEFGEIQEAAAAQRAQQEQQAALAQAAATAKDMSQAQMDGNNLLSATAQAVQGF